MEQHPLDRLPGETDREYLDRLRGLETAGWSVDDRMALALLTRHARRAFDAPARAALQRVKRLVRHLPEPERLELARWIAEGCRGDRAHREGGEGRSAADGPGPATRPLPGQSTDENTKGDGHARRHPAAPAGGDAFAVPATAERDRPGGA